MGGDLENGPGQAQPAAAGKRPSIGADLVIPVLASALASYYLISTAELDWEAKSAGLFVGTVVLAMCGFQILRILVSAIRGQGSLGFGDLIANTVHNRQRLALIALVALFIATIGWTGTTLGLFLLLLCSLWVMDVRKPSQLLGISFCTSAVVYGLLIYLLNTRLPRGVIEKLIAGLIGQEG